MRLQLCRMAMVLACILSASAQQGSTNDSAKDSKDIDPLALQVLKAATDPIRQSQSYSFRSLVGREHVATNDQMITLFHISDVTVQRPDKLHVDFKGRGKDVEFFFNAGKAVLYTPEDKLYTDISGPATIDATLEDMEKKDIFIPIRNFLESDPYQSLTDGLLSAYVIGEVKLYDQVVHQLAFTEAKAEWQLWVVGGDHPIVRRLEVIDKSQPGHPRTVVEFLDWKFNITPSPDLFTFQKPPDAKEIDLLKETAVK